MHQNINKRNKMKAIKLEIAISQLSNQFSDINNSLNKIKGMKLGQEIEQVCSQSADINNSNKFNIKDYINLIYILVTIFLSFFIYCANNTMASISKSDFENKRIDSVINELKNFNNLDSYKITAEIRATSEILELYKKDESLLKRCQKNHCELSQILSLKAEFKRYSQDGIFFRDFELLDIEMRKLYEILPLDEDNKIKIIGKLNELKDINLRIKKNYDDIKFFISGFCNDCADINMFQDDSGGKGYMITYKYDRYDDKNDAEIYKSIIISINDFSSNVNCFEKTLDSLLNYVFDLYKRN